MTMDDPKEVDVVVSQSKRSGRAARRRERTSYSPSPRTGDCGKRVLVDHTYIDHLKDPKRMLVQDSTSDGRPKRGAPRGGVTVAFPEKLHEMLTQMDEEDLTKVVSWQPHGRCFLVHKKKEFVENIMPRFFHQTKLTSFQRQLNLYGFVRLTAGRDRGAYYHELFIRGRPDLCRHMVRTRVKGNGMKAASNPQNEPNFYNMTACPSKGCVDVSDAAQICSMESSDVEQDDVVHEEIKEDEEQEPDEPKFTTTSETWIPDSELPIVSPVCSPKQPIRPLTQPVSISFLDLPDPMDDDGGDAIVLSPSIVSAEEADPRTGDEVFFEGLKFRYLDHVDCGGVGGEANNNQQTDYFSPFLDQIAGSMYL